ncbi:MAG: hypothetical protein J5J06_03740 [Phycisphaerae bacterium]|nr:hypothetical protein [Phycisphaerae bacterium]
MIRYECDRCGMSLGPNDAHRFIVKLEIYAAAGHIELTDRSTEEGSTLEGVLETLASSDPNDVEDQTYRAFRFDVCDRCRREVLQHPLG